MTQMKCVDPYLYTQWSNPSLRGGGSTKFSKSKSGKICTSVPISSLAILKRQNYKTRLLWSIISIMSVPWSSDWTAEAKKSKSLTLHTHCRVGQSCKRI